MAVTIKDVAERAGVSHPTVSRALRGDVRVMPETADRIRRIAHELGYVPSAAARSLKTNRTRVVGVLVHRVSDPFYSQVLDGIQDTLQAAHYAIFLASTNNDRARELQVIRAMRERRVEGLILCSMFITPAHRREINPHNAPLVLIHNRASQITPYTLYHDDRYGARQMTRHLIALGHTRIAFIGNARAGRVSRERLIGFRQEMRAAGLRIPPEYIVHAATGQAPSAQEPMRALLALKHPPTALVCFNDMLAIGAIQVLHAAGKRVPTDCSVAGFDDIPLAELMNPPLTTFNQPKYSLGVQAARMLLTLMDASESGQSLPNGNAQEHPPGSIESHDSRKRSRVPNAIVLRGEIVVRGSTAPPLAGSRARSPRPATR